MRKIGVIKKPEGLFPMSPSDIDEFNKIPNGLVTVVDVSEKRNVKLFRKTWGIARLILDNDREGKFRDKHHVIDALLIITGYVDQCWLMDGTFYLRPHSISWEKCSDEKFKEIYEKWLPHIMQYLDCTEEELNKNLIFYY